VDTKTELPDAILNQSLQKDSVSQLAKLKQAWREAEAHTSRGVRRSAEGLADEAIDEPLQAEVLESMLRTFGTYYNWPKISSDKMGCDSLTSRFRREFDRRQPSMFALARGRSLAATSRSAPVKRSRVSEGVVMEFRDTDVDESTSFLHMLEQMDLFALTWAVAGCFEVNFENKQVRYVHWMDVTDYMDTFRQKGKEMLAHYSEASVVAFVTVLEEQFRAKAIDLARGSDHTPWGTALTRSLASWAHLWQESRWRLLPKQGGATPRQTPPPPPPPSSSQSQQPRSNVARASGTGQTKKWATTNAVDDKTICKPFNDRRGCKSKNCKKYHCCDVVLEGGKKCASKDHSRKNHDAKKNGAPAIAKW
jgi:hypothetical protein